MRQIFPSGRWWRSLLSFSVLFWRAATAGAGDTNAFWRGVHLWVDRESSARELLQTLPALADRGVNVLVLEVNYSFEFSAHPELRQRHFITRRTAHELAAASRKCGIRLIPEFNCLGHQSFGRRIEPLLKTHPDWSETPLSVMTNQDFYCLSWCPRVPELNATIFSLLDELGAAFEADALHVGMDEVYYIAETNCPRCQGGKPAELFAAQINSLHQHLVGENKWQMLMWADRVIGPKYQGYSRFDTAQNDLSAALDLIPKDIVMCDWHYEWKRSYPSVPWLATNGFSVWPAGFVPLKASQAFSDFALTQTTNGVVGYLATTWNATAITNAPNWPPIKDILVRWKDVR